MTITESPTLTLTDITSAIARGDFDVNLRSIEQAIKNRKANLAREIVPSRFSSVEKTGVLGNISPKYLVGAPVTVVGRNRTRIVVTLDSDWLDKHPQAKARWTGEITVTPAMVVLDD